MILLKVHLVKTVQFRLALLKETKQVKGTMVYQGNVIVIITIRTEHPRKMITEVFRTRSRWKTKIKFFQLYYWKNLFITMVIAGQIVLISQAIKIVKL